ncbi:hypothetical protein GGF32_009599 [Allomyces javanicus]|nr:hypothetical protein GGF32_009599 [Allomyces javanicus]
MSFPVPSGAPSPDASAAPAYNACLTAACDILATQPMELAPIDALGTKLDADYVSVLAALGGVRQLAIEFPDHVAYNVLSDALVLIAHPSDLTPLEDGMIDARRYALRLLFANNQNETGALTAEIVAAVFARHADAIGDIGGPKALARAYPDLLELRPDGTMELIDVPPNLVAPMTLNDLAVLPMSDASLAKLTLDPIEGLSTNLPMRDASFDEALSPTQEVCGTDTAALPARVLDPATIETMLAFAAFLVERLVPLADRLLELTDRTIAQHESGEGRSGLSAGSAFEPKSGEYSSAPVGKLWMTIAPLPKGRLVQARFVSGSRNHVWRPESVANMPICPLPGEGAMEPFAKPDPVDVAEQNQRAMDRLLAIFPKHLSVVLEALPNALDSVHQIVLDLDQHPRITMIDAAGSVRRHVLNECRVVTRAGLAWICDSLTFTTTGCAGLDGSLHRISRLLNKNGLVIGLTIRMGRLYPPSKSVGRLLLDLIHNADQSILITGEPGSGRTLPTEQLNTRRLNGVRNHQPDIVVIDEIATHDDVAALQLIAPSVLVFCDPVSLATSLSNRLVLVLAMTDYQQRMDGARACLAAPSSSLTAAMGLEPTNYLVFLRSICDHLATCPNRRAPLSSLQDIVAKYYFAQSSLGGVRGLVIEFPQILRLDGKDGKEVVLIVHPKFTHPGVDKDHELHQRRFALRLVVACLQLGHGSVFVSTVATMLKQFEDETGRFVDPVELAAIYPTFIALRDDGTRLQLLNVPHRPLDPAKVATTPLLAPVVALDTALHGKHAAALAKLGGIKQLAVEFPDHISYDGGTDEMVLVAHPDQLAPLDDRTIDARQLALRLLFAYNDNEEGIVPAETVAAIFAHHAKEIGRAGGPEAIARAYLKYVELNDDGSMELIDELVNPLKPLSLSDMGPSPAVERDDASETGSWSETTSLASPRLAYTNASQPAASFAVHLSADDPPNYVECLHATCAFLQQRPEQQATLADLVVVARRFPRVIAEFGTIKGLSIEFPTHLLHIAKLSALRLRSLPDVTSLPSDALIHRRRRALRLVVAYNGNQLGRVPAAVVYQTLKDHRDETAGVTTTKALARAYPMFLRLDPNGDLRIVCFPPRLLEPRTPWFEAAGADALGEQQQQKDMPADVASASTTVTNDAASNGSSPAPPAKTTAAPSPKPAPTRSWKPLRSLPRCDIYLVKSAVSARHVSGSLAANGVAKIAVAVEGVLTRDSTAVIDVVEIAFMDPARNKPAVQIWDFARVTPGDRLGMIAALQAVLGDANRTVIMHDGRAAATALADVFHVQIPHTSTLDTQILFRQWVEFSDAVRAATGVGGFGDENFAPVGVDPTVHVNLDMLLAACGLLWNSHQATVAPAVAATASAATVRRTYWDLHPTQSILLEYAAFNVDQLVQAADVLLARIQALAAVQAMHVRARNVDGDLGGSGAVGKNGLDARAGAVNKDDRAVPEPVTAAASKEHRAAPDTNTEAAGQDGCTAPEASTSSSNGVAQAATMNDEGEDVPLVGASWTASPLPKERKVQSCFAAGGRHHYWRDANATDLMIPIVQDQDEEFVLDEPDMAMLHEHRGFDLDLLYHLLSASLRDELQDAVDDGNTFTSIVLDVGRAPLFFVWGGGGRNAALRFTKSPLVTSADLEAMCKELQFSPNNSAILDVSLHRFSRLFNKQGRVVGLTIRVGAAWDPARGVSHMLLDLICGGDTSILLVAKPGGGRTYVSFSFIPLHFKIQVKLILAIFHCSHTLRELTAALAARHHRVLVVDTDYELGGGDDAPHPALGAARRVHVTDRARQHEQILDSVLDHAPDVLVVDDVTTTASLAALRAVAPRVQAVVATTPGTLASVFRTDAWRVLLGGADANGYVGVPVFSAVVEVVDCGTVRVVHDAARFAADHAAGKVTWAETRSWVMVEDTADEDATVHQKLFWATVEKVE